MFSNFKGQLQLCNRLNNHFNLNKKTDSSESETLKKCDNFKALDKINCFFSLVGISHTY